jgi:hypothetical protein
MKSRNSDSLDSGYRFFGSAIFIFRRFGHFEWLLAQKLEIWWINLLDTPFCIEMRHYFRKMKCAYYDSTISMKNVWMTDNARVFSRAFNQSRMTSFLKMDLCDYQGQKSLFSWSILISWFCRLRAFDNIFDPEQRVPCPRRPETE